jgi:uncharacterized phage-associated protein
VVDGTKYREVLRYLLASDANNDKLGKVKLMKLLYYADFDHFEKHGKSITGDRYYKLPYGPVPGQAQLILESMRDAGLINVEHRPVFRYMKYYFSLTEKGTIKEYELHPDELATLAAVVEKWKNHSTEEIVLASHGEPPWQKVGYGTEIPYELVYFRENEGTSEFDEEPNELIPDLAIS